MSSGPNFLLQSALSYAERGWKVIPLLPRRKYPFMEEWQHHSSSDEEQIAAWWAQNPDYNIGVQLGPKSGIIDIEYDSDLGRETAAKLFAECHTPTYSSGSRSVHRLFRWTPELPEWSTKTIRGLEFRIGNAVDGNGKRKGTQSVFPPSIHPDGPTYRWQQSPDEVEIAEIPESVLALIVNDPEGKSLETTKGGKGVDWWTSIINGVDEGSRNETLTSMVGVWLRGLSDEGFNDRKTVRTILLNACAFGQRCNPPIEKSEIERTFQSVLRLETNRRASEEAFSIVKPSVVAQAAEGVSATHHVEGWWLVIVKSDPPRYELHSPDFSLAEGGKIILTAEQMASPGAIKVEALKQAQCGLPASFAKKWNKKGGLYEMLVSSAETIDAPPEEKRHSVVAEMILAEIEKAKYLQEGEHPPRRGTSVLPNGNTVFIFTSLVRSLSMMPEAPTRNEVSRVLKMVRAVKHYWQGNTRFSMITPESARMLRQLSGENTDVLPHEPHV